MKKVVSIILTGLMMFVLFGCQQGSDSKSKIDHYVDVQLKEIGIEENLAESGKQLNSIMSESMQDIQQGNMDEQKWKQSKEKIEKVLTDMEEKKKQLVQLQIEDEKVKEINGHLVKAYEQMISGYRQMIDGITKQDQKAVESAQQNLLDSKESIQKWQSMLNE